MINEYIKRRSGHLLSFILISIIFSLMTFLYGLPFGGIAYSLIICIIAFMIISAIDFVGYYKKHRELLSLYKSLDNLTMPRVDSLYEQDYQSIITLLYEKLSEIVTRNNNANSEMKDFYALWVHQIKTPISAMSLLLQSDYTVNGKIMRSELFKIERYTELVLNYLRLEDISSDLKIENTNLELAVKSAIKKFAPVFISKNIKISLQDLDVNMLTDEKWLIFAIEQIISNSLKYTNSGGIIKIYYSNASGLVIEDDGMGISPEDLPRIFEKGFTGYNGRMDKKATGIGLYLTKKTLDKLGHNIQITSDGIRGTVVKIDLAHDDIVYQ